MGYPGCICHQGLRVKSMPVPSPIPHQFDVLVIGSGAAGLYASLCLPSHLQVGLITKNDLKVGSSNWAQGGIAAAINPTDSPKFHLEDTVKAGAGLCDPKAAAFLVEHAPAAIEALLSLGVAFDKYGAQPATTLEAAHSHPRVLHSADTTGRAIIETLTAQVLNREHIHIFSHALTLQLWLHPQTGRCQGISLLHNNQIQWIQSAAVVLATGGGGQVFSQTTNPTVSTGDGVAMAWRAGALLRDLEFFQFHPTALTQPGAPRFLISEAVRGEGAYLIDEGSDRFTFTYHPKGELAPRDVVSRAIFSHLQQQQINPNAAHVYLDLSPIAPEKIRTRFPKIIQVCKQWGINVFQDPIPVAPAAHYWMGGIAVDLKCQTSIPGLYAVGETASTGVHGANRLASNSLLECVVFGAQLSHIPLDSMQLEAGCSEPHDSVPLVVQGQWEQDWQRLQVIRRTLPQLMWEHAGVYRQGDSLQQAQGQVKAWREEVSAFEVSQYVLNVAPKQGVKFEQAQAEPQLQVAAETLNLLDIANLILMSAAFRTESRGGHYRVDCPHSLDHWQMHSLVQGDAVWTSA